jgi:hypothetical protein
VQYLLIEGNIAHMKFFLFLILFLSFFVFLTNKANKNEFLLKKSDSNLITSFNIIKNTYTGKKLLDLFIPEYNNNLINIKHLSTDIRNKFELPDNWAAFFYFDGKEKTIYVNFNEDPIIIATFLIHEITHATDKEYINLHSKISSLKSKYYETKSEAIKEEILKLTNIREFKTEKKAYSSQYTFIKELEKAYPQKYGEYLLTLMKRGIQTYDLSDNIIISKYYLKI